MVATSPLPELNEDLKDCAARIAAHEGFDSALVCGLIEQESNWNPFAIRPESESGFARRYGAAYRELVKESATKLDDHWFRFEDLFYCSYGLTQTIYAVVIETFPSMARQLKYPTELCAPELNIKLGLGILKAKIRRAGPAPSGARAGWSLARGLLFYNGGGNVNYPAEVFAKAERYKTNGDPK